MSSTQPAYQVPEGFTTPQLLYRSVRYFRRNPVVAITKNMEKMGTDTYSAMFPGKQLVIFTQDAAFINHVLRENHTNYQKSTFTADKGAALFGKGLLFANGAYWLKQRRLIQPGFHSKKIRGLYSIVTSTIDGFLEHFPAGAAVNVYPLMHEVAFKIAIRSLFDIDLPDATIRQIGQLFTDVQGFLVKEIRRPFFTFTSRISGERKRAQQKATQLRELVRGIIRDRQQHPGEYNDLLDMLLSARYEDTGAPMDEQQIIDEVLILLIAGHETTANTLTWLLWLLAPQENLQQQLRATIAQTPVHDSAQNPLVNAVINEAMRLRPAAWLTDRVALEDDCYGNISYPKGTIVMPFFYGMHHSRQYWPESEQFNPHRFIDEQGQLKKTPAFFPFGAGPRMCIGNNFAMAEMCFFVHSFLQRFSVAPTAQIPVMQPQITLRPDAVWLQVKPV